jgi:AmmeMemoRadiSam system protein B
MSALPDAPDPHAKPKLRRGLSAVPVDGGVVLADQVRLGRPVQLTRLGLELARRFDGRRTLRDIQAELMLVTGGSIVPLDVIATLAAGLDEALLLDSPRFAEHVNGPVRKPACIGCYEADPAKLRAQLRRLFTAPGGPGLPEHDGDKPRCSPDGRLRAALLPHMDYARGNVTYGWGFKELAERTDATVFVIVATSHYSPHRFTLTRKNFETPLGVVETDQGYIDRLEAEYGDGLFEDEQAHLPEHSIELEVVLLQYLFESRRPFKIVPLLVGSFADCVYLGRDPAEATDITRMVEALRSAEAGCAEPVCYLISGDLAHIGPKFGDDEPVADPFLAESRGRDEAILARVEAADPTGFYEVIAKEQDRRRICGLPPTYLTLAAARPTKGRVLHYQQFVHAQGYESVSFAAAAFYE